MRMRNEESGSDRKSGLVVTYIPRYKKNKLLMAKYNTSVEKRLEGFWFRSKTLGWNYSDFVAHLLEVLVVLRHRESANHTAASKRRIAK